MSSTNRIDLNLEILQPSRLRYTLVKEEFGWQVTTVACPLDSTNLKLKKTLNYKYCNDRLL
jgi:hypothetical protein